MESALERPKQVFTAANIPAYDSLRFGFCSPERMNSLEAFDFSKKEGERLGLSMRLQTLGQAVAIRSIFERDVKKQADIYETEEAKALALDRSHDYQRTSTVSLRLKNDGSFKVDAPYVVGFADLDDSDESRKLVQKGYDANSDNKELIIVKTAFVCDLVAKARDTERVAPALTKRPFVLPVAQVSGKSEYGQSQYAKAAFGDSKIAELNAAYLKDKGLEFGKFGDFTVEELEELLEGKDDIVHVGAVGLGGDDCNVIGGVVADGSFGSGGRARSVVHVGKKFRAQ